MVSRKQIRIFRSAFLMICILPTAIQIWSLLPGTSTDSQTTSKKESRFLQFDDESRNDSAALSDQLESPGKKRNSAEGKLERFPWLNRLGVDSDLIKIGGQFSLHLDRLPASHPLRVLSANSIKVWESQQAVTISIEQAGCSLPGLNSLLTQWFAGQFDSLTQGPTLVKVEIANFFLAESDASGSPAVNFRGVNLEFRSGEPKISIAGRLSRQEAKDGVDQGQIEIPFQIMAARNRQNEGDINPESFELVARRFPVWLLGDLWSSRLGERAEISGTFRMIRPLDGNVWVEFQGAVSQASCEELTVWLDPRNQPLASGSAQIICQKLIGDSTGIRTFQGEIRGPSSGTVSSQLAQLIGSSAQWTVPDSIVEYRSFLFDIDFSKREGTGASLRVSSKYEGGQLIWTSEGLGVLITSPVNR